LEALLPLGVPEDGDDACLKLLGVGISDFGEWLALSRDAEGHLFRALDGLDAEVMLDGLTREKLDTWGGLDRDALGGEASWSHDATDVAPALKLGARIGDCVPAGFLHRYRYYERRASRRGLSFRRGQAQDLASMHAALVDLHTQ